MPGQSAAPIARFLVRRSMIRRFVRRERRSNALIGRMTSAVAGLCLLAATGTASAQFYRDYVPGPQSYPLMGATTPDEVLSIIRSMDFEPLTMPLLRRQTYRVRAVDRDGEEVRIVVDARVGRVLSVTPLAPQLSRSPGYDAYNDDRRLQGNGFRGNPVQPRSGNIPDEPQVIYGSRNREASAPRTVPSARMPASPQEPSAPRDVRSPQQQQDAARQDAARQQDAARSQSQSARAAASEPSESAPQSETPAAAPVPRSRPAQVARDASQEQAPPPSSPTVAPPVRRVGPPATIESAPLLEPTRGDVPAAAPSMPPVQGFE